MLLRHCGKKEGKKIKEKMEKMGRRRKNKKKRERSRKKKKKKVKDEW